MKDSSLNKNARSYTLSAIIIGYLLTYDYSSYMQNAIGNWFMTIGQILEANAAIMQAIDEPNYNSSNPYYISNKKEIDEIKKEINNIIDKINNLNL